MDVSFRPTTVDDLAAVVGLLADDAIRFYEALGFTASHEGLKLRL